MLDVPRHAHPRDRGRCIQWRIRRATRLSRLWLSMVRRLQVEVGQGRVIVRAVRIELIG